MTHNFSPSSRWLDPHPVVKDRVKRRTLLCLLATLLFTLCGHVGAATFISGKVTDPDGDPIVGASVIGNVAGVGTITDDSGKFSLSPPEEVTRLTFSSVGFSSTQYDINAIPSTVILQPRYYHGQDILVRADRAEPGITPIAYSNFTQDDIKRDYTVEEFPLLLESTPNLYSYSDAGSSLGYSYMSIRGFDDKRIVTYINGVPLNDPEDQATYFVDLPDFAANVSDIQIQRGVGNSLYGDASFGGTVNIVTSALSNQRQASIVAGYGQYTLDGRTVSDIYKQSVEYTSGLIDGTWQFGGRFSKQRTGGFRHDSWYDGWSYYFSLARLDPRMTTELYVYGGPMRMHLAYYGSPRDEIAKDYRYNPLTYNNETDNFNQPHYQLQNTYRLSDRATLYNTFYHIHGDGYYEQLKANSSLSDYGIDTNFIDINPITSARYDSGNVVRQQWVSKNQTGWNPRIDLLWDKGRHSLGGSFYYFDSDHWGQVVYAEHITGSFDPRHRYYQYHGKKYVASVFGQEYYKFNDKLSAQITAQLRYLKYDFNQRRMLPFEGYEYSVDWAFLSPRIGFNYKYNDAVNFYTNFSVASRTPSDAAIYDAGDPHVVPSLNIIDSSMVDGVTSYNFGDPTAKSERVYDFELGGNYQVRKYSFGLNLYWMEFKNEILPYGGINPNTGIAITINADRSVHAGLELTGACQISPRLSVQGNFAYSYNRVRKFVADVDGFNVNYNNKTIPFFPAYLGNVLVDYKAGNARFTFRQRFVGKQYAELWNVEGLTVNSYTISALSVSYKLGDLFGTGDLVFEGKVDNLFDQKVETSGYGGDFAYDNGTSVVVDGWAEYYVLATRSFYGQVKLALF